MLVREGLRAVVYTPRISVEEWQVPLEGMSKPLSLLFGRRKMVEIDAEVHLVPCVEGPKPRDLVLNGVGGEQAQTGHDRDGKSEAIETGTPGKPLRGSLRGG
jgi:hypothetical protein